MTDLAVGTIYQGQVAPEVVKWFISKHAFERMKEMSVERDEVVSTLDDPDTDYPSSYKGGARVATKDRLAVVYDPSEFSVITVLWNRKESR